MFSSVSILLLDFCSLNLAGEGGGSRGCARGGEGSDAIDIVVESDGWVGRVGDNGSMSVGSIEI